MNNDRNNLRMMLREALDNLWSRIRALFWGLDDRVTALEQGGGGGGGGDVNVIEAVSFNGVNVPPDANKCVSMTESDPTVPDWAKAATKPTYTAQEVGAIPSLTIEADITQADNAIPEGTAARSASLTVTDSNGRVIGSIQVMAYRDGRTSIVIVAQNSVDGALTASSLVLMLNKNGTTVYGLSKPDSFRTAISAQQDVGFYVDTQGYLCQRIRSDT